MRKSKFLKKLGKISDYIFGFGDNEHWNEETAFYREFREEEDLKSGLKYIETKKPLIDVAKTLSILLI